MDGNSYGRTSFYSSDSERILFHTYVSVLEVVDNIKFQITLPTRLLGEHHYSSPSMNFVSKFKCLCI